MKTFYFVVQTLQKQRVGTVGIYDISDGQAEWGRFVLVPPSTAALGTALLTYRFAFETLNLTQVSCWTMQQNAKVVAFHDRLGLPSIVEHRPVLTANGAENRPFCRHTLRACDWPAVADKWTPVAEQARRYL